MANLPHNLASQITELKDEFQRVADGHGWICYFIPQYWESRELPWVGEFAPGAILPSLGLYGVTLPRNGPYRVLVDHVTQLTSRAILLMKQVVEYDSTIPAYLRENIRYYARKPPGDFAWARWLRYATPLQHICRYEHYPQVAATALFELKEYYRPVCRVSCEPSDRSVFLDGKRLAGEVDEDVFAYFEILARQYPHPTCFAEIQRQSPALLGVNQSRLKKKIPVKLSRMIKANRNKGHVLCLPD